MTSDNGRAARLAHRLRQLRLEEWPEANLTQVDLAAAFAPERSLSAPTLSSWESRTNPTPPTQARLHQYARFFATRRSLEGKPHLLSLSELDGEEKDRFDELEQELTGLFKSLEEDEAPAPVGRRQLLSFEGEDEGPVVIICPEAPADSRGPLSNSAELNYTELHGYADIDALLEVFGHIRALNPTVPVLRKLPSTVAGDELQNHVVLLGGIGWNRVLRRISTQIKQMPIEQFGDPEFSQGELFRLRKSEDREERVYRPVMVPVEDESGKPVVDENGQVKTEQTEDVALLARLRNPFHVHRTLTICNGIYSRGVVGAVLTVTDQRVRPTNEEYLARHYPDGEFAMLLRVPVVDGKVLAPDLMNPETRLFEWVPGREGG